MSPAMSSLFSVSTASSRATIRRSLLVLLAGSLLSLPLLLILAPDNTHDHPHYMTLRHPLPMQPRPPPPPSLEVPLGTEKPMIGGGEAALLDGGGDIGARGEGDEGQEKQEEAVAKERETQQGEKETEKMRAMEEEQEDKVVDGKKEGEKQQNEEEKEQQGPSSSSSSFLSSSSSSWPPPSWAWPLNEDHQTFGAKRFGIRFPASSAVASTSCTGGGGKEGEKAAEEMDFTLVSQTSPDRLWMLGHICQRWQGPIILAVFIRGYGPEHDALLDRIYCPQARLLRVRPPPARQGEEEEDSVWGSPDQFPVNALRCVHRRVAFMTTSSFLFSFLLPTHSPTHPSRNLAIAEVGTTHFLLTDMDLWPSR